MTFAQSLTQCVRTCATAQTLLLVGVLALPMPALAQTRERLSDNGVKALLKQVDDDRDKFEGNLDGSFKDSTLRSATAEVKVSVTLQELQDKTKKLPERFSSDYAAGPEVEALLKQASAIDAYVQRTPSLVKGRSEWEHMAATLKSLAGAYGTTFPIPDGAAVRRMNDAETAGAANALANAADQYKDQVNSDKVLVKADKDAGKASADALKKAAQALKSRVSDGKPASAELKSTMDAAATLEAFSVAHPLPQAAAAWSGIRDARAKLEQSFALPR